MLLGYFNTGTHAMIVLIVSDDSRYNHPLFDNFPLLVSGTRL